MSNKTPFEQAVQESLENYEAPYDPSAWEGIEAELDRMGSSPESSGRAGQSTGKWVAIAAGGAALVAGSLLFFGSGEDEEEGNDPGAKHEIVAERSDKDTEGTGGDHEEKISKDGDDQELSKIEEEKNAEAPSEEAENPEKEEEASLANKEPQKSEAEKEESGKEGSENRSTEIPNDENGSLQEEKEEKIFPEALNVRISRQKGCAPLKVAFDLSEELKGMNYFWDLGDGNYSNKASPTHLYREAGSYDVSLTLTDPSSGRTKKIDLERTIVVHQGPKGEIEKVPADRRERSARPITVFELKESREIDRIVWDLGDGTRVQGKQRVEHRYAAKGFYKVRAILTSENGCRDTLRYRYEKKQSYDLLAPNSFQPNGNGRNDQFIPEALKVLDVPFTLTIHDRSGRVVYKTKNASEPWNGRVQNSGSKVEDGSVFLWVVVLENKKGEEETYKGHVTVIR